MQSRNSVDRSKSIDVHIQPATLSSNEKRIDFLYPSIENVKTKTTAIKFYRAKNINMFHVKDELKGVPVSYLNNTSTLVSAKRSPVSFLIVLLA